MNQKFTGTDLWLRDHPHDTPPEGDGNDPQVRAWRARRGIGGTPWQRQMRRKYDEIMAEKRAAAIENPNPEKTT